MGRRGLLVTIPAIVIVSAIIAYALVFWTPWFGQTNRGSYVVGIDYTYSTAPYTKGYFSAEGGFGDVGRLFDLYPDYAREVLTKIFNELIRLENHQLYVLKTLDDVCGAGTIECWDVSSKEVKPLIEAALAHRQSLETGTVAWRSLYVAAGGLFVSFLLLGIAALTFTTRKRH